MATAHTDYDPTHATKRRVKAQPPAQVDVAIIGAGLGGLMAGAKLSQEGMKVAVFDQHYVAGGCCTMFSRGGPRSRRNFDIGLHYIGDCQPDGAIPQMLQSLGIEDMVYEPLDPDGFDTLVFPDLEFRIPVGRAAYRQRLLDTFPEDKRGIDRYIRFLDEVETMMGLMAAKPSRWQMAWTAVTQGRMVSRHMQSTLADVLDQCTQNPALRAVIAGQSGDYGLPPSQVSALLHAGLVNHYFSGAYYPRGGGQVIADKLAQKIEAEGGSVHLRRGIESILVEGGRAVGVRTEMYKGQQFEVRAEQVISNADLPRTLTELMPQDQQTAVQSWPHAANDMKMAAALFICCLNVKGDMRSRGMRNANYWQFDGYDMEGFYAATDLRPRGCYITAATLKDPHTPHHAPAGEDSVEVMTVLPGDPSLWGAEADQIDNWKYKKSATYQAHKERIQDDLIARLDRLFPGSAANVSFAESATPLSHGRYTRATAGTGYGLAATPDQFMGARPGYSGPIPGLFLAGASTRAGHGVVGSMRSGEACARRVLKTRAMADA
nr:NAD(P)/FAD-dependent oxidoreductase [Oceanococcus sp. HetDA_MAG_MS8]